MLISHKFKKGNIKYYSTWHCACVAQRRVFLNIRFVIDTCPCYQSTLVHDIVEVCKETYPKTSSRTWF
ncbi:hypothetical protein SERLA73DRAFT_174733 [Serpula lacrymans var. lacrymans S7.3]|uniref:Uncharacterized protein n=1 Tax=Serpula lacrymans var. lacrymans (strain S7.3) TaxID=936435 RepID=F8PKG3_SERL3|nr:hypothetical protein SERLA73DRAFT_174733 [Serpula lacrymans var. lacrymans S7.3]